MTPTEEYIEILTHLKSGELGLLRSMPGKGSTSQSTDLTSSRGFGGHCEKKIRGHPGGR